MPPVTPMLAKSVTEIPAGGRATSPSGTASASIIFRDGDEVEIGSRNERPMTRYFPELVEALRASCPPRVRDRRRDRRRRVRRPASTSRRCSSASTPPRAGSAMLAETTPASVRRLRPARARRRRPHGASRSRSSAARAGGGARRTSGRRCTVTPATADRAEAARLVRRSSRAPASTGVIAKPLDGTYQPDKRAMFKIKHERTADCVVAGYRLHKAGAGRDRVAAARAVRRRTARCASVGVDRRVPDGARREPLRRAAAARRPTFDEHPWDWAGQEAARAHGRRDAEGSPVERRARTCRSCRCGPELVVEVRYDHMEGNRFRHTAQFRPLAPGPRTRESCTYEQLEAPDGPRPARPDPADLGA